MNLGIGSYTFTWAVGVPGHPPAAPLTARQLCERAVSLGVRVVQFADNLPLLRLPAPELDAVIGFASDHRLELEIGTRGLLTGDLAGYLALARRLGARFVRVVIDEHGFEPSPADAVRHLQPIVERYAEAGVKVALENHDRFPAATLAAMVGELGPAAGITLDTVNSLGALEGPAEVVRLLAPHTLNLHLKDFTVRRVPSQMGFVVEGAPAGLGRLDVPWLLDELRRLNPRADRLNAILELWTPPAASLNATLEREADWARESVLHLRRWIPD